jgi:hypothetical protein
MKGRTSAGRLGLLALCSWLAVTLAAAQAPEVEQLQRRLQSVATLIESSSAARQIETSGEAAAREKRDIARLVHREAVATLQAGDAAGAARLLDQAAREMMSGVRLARPEQGEGAKAEHDFRARLDSARALLAAQQRITQEKGRVPGAVAATRDIEALIVQAEQHAAAGRIDEARPLVDRAYLVARVAIEGMRRGDTLVRSLNFGSPREEYAYEIDRNDTHRMLIQVLLADRKDTMAATQGPLERAAALRAEAEAAARRGEHAQAIQHLEASTRELVRAIRAGGVYIPG